MIQCFKYFFDFAEVSRRSEPFMQHCVPKGLQQMALWITDVYLDGSTTLLINIAHLPGPPKNILIAPSLNRPFLGSAYH